MADFIQKLADEGEAAYRTGSADAFAAWLIPNVLLILGALKTLAELDGVSHWVPVAERLPDRSGMYLIWDGEDYEAARWNDGDFYRLFGEESPTHWMPLRLEPPVQPHRGRGE